MIYTVRRDGAGRLSTMPRPRGGDLLDGELARLRELGATVLVSALTPVEQDELELTAEAERARAAGLEFVSVPVPDFGVPDAPAVLPVLRDLAERVTGGGHVVIHCRGGVGRSSVLAAGVLALEGLAPAEAYRRIGAARGCPVPETDAQRAWPDALLAAARG